MQPDERQFFVKFLQTCSLQPVHKADIKLYSEKDLLNGCLHTTKMDTFWQNAQSRNERLFVETEHSLNHQLYYWCISTLVPKAIGILPYCQAENSNQIVLHDTTTINTRYIFLGNGQVSDRSVFTWEKTLRACWHLR